MRKHVRNSADCWCEPRVIQADPFIVVHCVNTFLRPEEVERWEAITRELEQTP